MTQSSPGTVNPTTTSGTALATLITSFGGAVETCNSGATPPSYAKIGTLWVDTSLTPNELKICYNAAPLWKTIARIAVDVASRAVHSGGTPAFTPSLGSDQVPVATEFYICEIHIPAAQLITGIAIVNGSAVSGNVKVGLADVTGAVVATSASTAQSGTDVYQRVPFAAPVVVAPGTYFVLVFLDNTTGRLRAHQFGNFGASKKTGQTFATGFTTITIPTTFTADLGTLAATY